MPGKQMNNFSASVISFIFIVMFFLIQGYCMAADCPDLGMTVEAYLQGQGGIVIAESKSTCGGDSSDAVIRLHVAIPGFGPDPDVGPTGHTSETHFTFVFDEELFEVHNPGAGNKLESGDIIIFWVTWYRGSSSYNLYADYKVRLKKKPDVLTSDDLKEKIVVKAEQVDRMWLDKWEDPYDNCDRAEYSSPEFVALEVGIEMSGDDEISFTSSGSGSGSGGSGGCSSCPSGGASGEKKSIGHDEVDVFSEQGDTLDFNSSVFEYVGSYYPEINVGGSWIKPHSTFMSGTGWSTAGIQCDTSGDDVTKVWYEVTDPAGLKYRYELDGTWDSGFTVDHNKKLACEEIAGGVDMELEYVYDKVNDVTLKSYTYGTPTTSGGFDYKDITVDVGDGTLDRYVVYQMKKATAENEYKLARIWMGDDTSLKAAPGSTPSGGRWIDIKTENNIESDVPLITESGCSSCGAARMGYEYAAGSYNKSDGTPTRHLVTKVKSIDSSQIETVLGSYDYDSRDRLAKRWLGDKDGNGEVAMEATQGDTTRLQKDYIDSTSYRATVALYDNYGRITERRHYHDLQTSAEPTGTFSRLLYKTESNGSNKLTKEITYLPKGNTVVKEYGTSGANDGRTIKRQRQSVVEAEYSYTTVINDEKLSLSTNPKGKTTSYSYGTRSVNSVNVITKQTTIEPKPGVFGKTADSDRLTTSYYYDLSNRVTKQEVSGNNPTIEYDYDTFGNLTEQRHGSSVTTKYEYNEFNEQTLSYQTDGTSNKNIVGTTYDHLGRLEEQFSYNSLTLTPANVISGTAYEYDDEGRLETKKTVLDYVASALTWALETYEYDEYGRKTKATVDPSGENISTTYEYNYQGEVTKVIRPDLSSTTTVRDGRGLVSEVINAKGTNSSTTKYYYDLNGNLTKQEDPEGVCDYYKYDTFDRKILHRRGK